MKFRTSDVLSVSTGTLLPRKDGTNAVEGLYQVLNHMTGDNLMTHQLLLALPIMRPYLVAEHPWLDDVEVPMERDLKVLEDWVDGLVAEHGEQMEITAHPESWGDHNPIEDLYTLKPDANVIVVEMADEES